MWSRAGVDVEQDRVRACGCVGHRDRFAQRAIRVAHSVIRVRDFRDNQRRQADRLRHGAARLRIEVAVAVVSGRDWMTASARIGSACDSALGSPRP